MTISTMLCSQQHLAEAGSGIYGQHCPDFFASTGIYQIQRANHYLPRSMYDDAADEASSSTETYMDMATGRCGDIGGLAQAASLLSLGSPEGSSGTESPPHHTDSDGSDSRQNMAALRTSAPPAWASSMSTGNAFAEQHQVAASGSSTSPVNTRFPGQPFQQAMLPAVSKTLQAADSAVNKTLSSASDVQRHSVSEQSELASQSLLFLEAMSKAPPAPVSGHHGPDHSMYPHQLSMNKQGAPQAPAPPPHNSDSKRARWVQPSGPRRQGQGVENIEQGIANVEKTASGQVMVTVTLLAAGFLIGPGGTSVREIGKRTGSDIKSWTAQSSGDGTGRPVRVFHIDGSKDACRKVLEIMSDAVDHYKYLCEGKCSGKVVSRIHRIRGIDFSYQPPPRNIVPFAAALLCSAGRPLPASSMTSRNDSKKRHQQTQQDAFQGVSSRPRHPAGTFLGSSCNASTGWYADQHVTDESMQAAHRANYPCPASHLRSDVRHSIATSGRPPATFPHHQQLSKAHSWPKPGGQPLQQPMPVQQQYLYDALSEAVMAASMQHNADVAPTRQDRSTLSAADLYNQMPGDAAGCGAAVFPSYFAPDSLQLQPWYSRHSHQEHQAEHECYRGPHQSADAANHALMMTSLYGMTAAPHQPQNQPTHAEGSMLHYGLLADAHLPTHVTNNTVMNQSHTQDFPAAFSPHQASSMCSSDNVPMSEAGISGAVERSLVALLSPEL